MAEIDTSVSKTASASDISTRQTSTILRIHRWAIWFGSIYGVILLLFCLDPVQRNFIYLHRLKWDNQLDHPEAHGYLPGKVLPFSITTPDNMTLGAWQVLPESVYEEYVSEHGFVNNGSLPVEVFKQALERFNTVLFCHGNAATRGFGTRVRTGQFLSAQNNNFLIFDYRGFADSTPVEPSEEGLLIDARAAWDYLAAENNVSPDKITVMGHSLGTGVASGLVASLTNEGTLPRSLVLVSPFSSLPHLLKKFKLFKVFPILEPLNNVPRLLELVLSTLKTKFDTFELIRSIRSPILIIHAQNDRTINYLESRRLVTRLVTPLQPDLRKFSEMNVSRQQAGEWGFILRFNRGLSEQSRRELTRIEETDMVNDHGVGAYDEGYWGPVVYAESIRGGHNDIGISEMTLRLIKEVNGKGLN